MCELAFGDPEEDRSAPLLGASFSQKIEALLRGLKGGGGRSFYQPSSALPRPFHSDYRQIDAFPIGGSEDERTLSLMGGAPEQDAKAVIEVVSDALGPIALVRKQTFHGSEFLSSSQ